MSNITKFVKKGVVDWPGMALNLASERLKDKGQFRAVSRYLLEEIAELEAQVARHEDRVDLSFVQIEAALKLQRELLAAAWAKHIDKMLGGEE